MSIVRFFWGGAGLFQLHKIGQCKSAPREFTQRFVRPGVHVGDALWGLIVGKDVQRCDRKPVLKEGLELGENLVQHVGQCHQLTASLANQAASEPRQGLEIVQMIKRWRVWLVLHRHEVTSDIVRVDRVGLCFPQRFTADKPGNEKWVELHEGEAVGLQEQLQILPVVACGLKSDLYVILQTAQPFPKQGKALAVVAERSRGQDGVPAPIDDNAVVLEFENVNACKIHGVFLSIFALLFPQLACPCTHANETSKR